MTDLLETLRDSWRTKFSARALEEILQAVRGNRVGDTAWLSQYRLLSAFHEDPVDDAEDLARRRIVNWAAAVAGVRGSVQLEHWKSAIREAPDRLRVEIAGTALRNRDRGDC